MRIGVLADHQFITNVFSPADKESLRALGEVDFGLCDVYADLCDEEQIQRLQSYDVLIGGWGAGRLPEAYAPAKEQYYCMCTGTVAQQMSPEHLERGLRLTNWGDAISQYISESALMQILASVRMLGLYYQRTHVEKDWARDLPPSQSLFDRHVGLLGCGVIAQRLIPLLRPFSPTISTYDPYVSDEKLAELGVQRAETVEELFTQCDIISNHLPKVIATNDVVNAAMLALLPDHAVFVNTARGNSVDEVALAAEHQRGRLFSALDVFKEEPLPAEHPLRNEPRCIITCHQAGPTRDGYFKMGERALENIRRFKNGENLLQELFADNLRRMT